MTNEQENSGVMTEALGASGTPFFLLYAVMTKYDYTPLKTGILILLRVVFGLFLLISEDFQRKGCTLFVSLGFCPMQSFFSDLSDYVPIAGKLAPIGD